MGYVEKVRRNCHDRLPPSQTEAETDARSDRDESRYPKGEHKDGQDEEDGARPSGIIGRFPSFNPEPRQREHKHENLGNDAPNEGVPKSPGSRCVHLDSLELRLQSAQIPCVIFRNGLPDHPEE